MAGHVYILINAAMPGLLKIGMTTRTPDDRARELSQGTGTPTPFVVAYSEEVSDSAAAESLIHTRLDPFRVNQGREFFNLPLRDAIREVAFIAGELRRLPPPVMPTPVGDPDGVVGVLTAPTPLVVPSPSPAPNRGAVIAVLAVLRKHFQGVKNTYLHPDIPPSKRQNARERYGQLLQPNEEVLLVYDGTWFGSAKNGIIFTERGIGWAERGSSPNYCPYPEMKPDEVCNGWTAFFVQGDRRADVFQQDRAKMTDLLQKVLSDLWRQRV